MIKKCLNCGCDISHKHPNAKFCKNKGRGNCKDVYHNNHNPRGLGADNRSDYDYYLDSIHPFSSEAFDE